MSSDLLFKSVEVSALLIKTPTKIMKAQTAITTDSNLGNVHHRTKKWTSFKQIC